VPKRCGHTQKVECIRAEKTGLNVFRYVAAGHGQAPSVGDEGIFDNRSLANLLPLRPRDPEVAHVSASQFHKNQDLWNCEAVDVARELSGLWRFEGHGDTGTEKAHHFC